MTSIPNPTYVPGAKPARQKRLLIVEDESVVAFDLTVALEDMGYTVVATAASSDAALRLADEKRPDLILMDIKISGRADGIQTGTMLRLRHQVPLVYLTANVDATTLSRALATDPAGYLVKPYNEHSLRTTIEVAFRQHEAKLALRREHEVERAQLEAKYREATSLVRQFRRDSICDPLTGLYNRRRLQHVVKREISFGQRDGHAVGFILLDLDRFKQLNDTFGHAAGDCALRAVADLVRARIRIYDIACRYGGEELVVVVPGADTTAAAALAEHLRASIEHLSVSFTGVELPQVTASFGVSAFPDHGWDLGAVLRAADTALYQAKAGGRNLVVAAAANAAAANAAAAASQPPASPHDALDCTRRERLADVVGDELFTGELEVIDDLELAPAK